MFSLFNLSSILVFLCLLRWDLPNVPQADLELSNLLRRPAEPHNHRHACTSSLLWIEMAKVCWSLIFSKKTFHSIDAHFAVFNGFHLCSNVYCCFDSVYTKFICFSFSNFIKPKGRLVMDSRLAFWKPYITSVCSYHCPCKCCFGLVLRFDLVLFSFGSWKDLFFL